MGKGRKNLVRGDDNLTHHLEEVEDVKVASISSGPMVIFRKAADIDDGIEAMYRHVDAEMDHYTENGSGFTWIQSLSLDVSISRFVTGLGRNNRSASIEFNNLGGGSWVLLPEWLRTRRVVNPKPSPRDEKCFVWAILRALYPHHSNTGVKDLVLHFDEVKLPEGTEFPIHCNDRFMRKVEELNDFSFSIFMLGKKDYDVSPLYVTQKRKPKHILLGIVEGVRKQGPKEITTNHYVVIPNLSAVLGKDQHNKIWYCENCFSRHRSEQTMLTHERDCKGNKPTRIIMPRIGDRDHKLIFTQWRYKLPALFTVYADLEALLTPTNTETGNPAVFAKHKPCAWSYWIKCFYPEHKDALGADGRPLGEVRSYCGVDSMHCFLESLSADAEVCEEIVKSQEYSEYKGDVPPEYHEATICHICEEEGFSLTDPARKKVLDHDHINGEYRGPAHSQCNLQYYSTKHYRLPIFFHNLKGYDGYHIIRGLKGYTDGIESMSCIARNLDKFTSFTIDNLRFADSMQFLLGSLDANVEAIKRDKSIAELKEAFYPVVEAFGLETEQENDRFMLLMGKGVYPYEYMKSAEVMEQTELPPIEEFYSSLRGGGISQEDYERAQKCWEAFGCKTLADYTLLYCKLDVLQLASCFEIFRQTCIAPDGVKLDPAHFITAPSLSWHAMLLRNRMNGVEIENMTDLSMMMMTEKGVRGGMCMVMKPYLTTAENRHGFYWDANNLYGWTMSEPMPYGDYRWEKLPEEIEEIMDEEEEVPVIEGPTYQELKMCQENAIWHLEDMDRLMAAVLELDPEGERGWVLEIDTEYPKELHDLHNEMPFLPEKKSCVPSPFTISQIKKVNPKYDDTRPSKVEKLVLDLEPKSRYVVHYRMLQEAIRHGVKITKVHRVFSFKQSRWLKEFIDFCTFNRAKCKDDPGKNTWKLFANSIYGKTVEDVRVRRDVEIILGADARERALRVASSPWCKQWRVVINDELIVMEKHKQQCTLNRPVIIGFCVLEISKLHMYDWHYNHIKPAFGDRARLYYMDTDSTVYGIESQNINKELYDLQMEKNCFDLSKIKDKNHPLLQDLGNGICNFQANVLGKFKDEMLGVPIISAVFLRPKSYSVLIDGGKAHSKMKGIPKTATLPDGRKIEYQDYEDVFRGTIMPKVKFQRLEHDKHYHLLTRNIEKLGLTATDDKSYYINTQDSWRYGHWRIQNHIVENKVAV
jgi:hypothetical protein